jgi:hypothetical protein
MYPEPDPDSQLWLEIGTVNSVMDNFRICWDDLFRIRIRPYKSSLIRRICVPGTGNEDPSLKLGQLKSLQMLLPDLPR